MQRFVLIDAYPGMTDKVIQSIGKYPRIVKHRVLREGNVDVLAVVEGADPDAIADYVAGSLRFLEGVYTVRLADEAEEDLSPVVRKAMQDLRK